MMNLQTANLMTKEEIKSALLDLGIELSNKSFKATKKAVLVERLLSELSKVIPVEVELEIIDGECIPNPESLIPVKEIVVEPIKEVIAPVVKDLPRYFQNKATLIPYRYHKSIRNNGNEIIVFISTDQKAHNVSRVHADKYYVSITSDEARRLMNKAKEEKAVSLAKRTAYQAAKAQALVEAKKNVKVDEPTCEVNVKVVDGQRQLSVTGLKTGKTVAAKEGRTLTNLFKAYEMQIEGLTVKVSFTEAV